MSEMSESKKDLLNLYFSVREVSKAREYIQNKHYSEFDTDEVKNSIREAIQTLGIEKLLNLILIITDEDLANVNDTIVIADSIRIEDENDFIRAMLLKIAIDNYKTARSLIQLTQSEDKNFK